MLVVYKSKNQSTKQIAKIIASKLNILCVNKLTKYNSDFVFYGSWLNKSKVCKAIYKDIKYLKDKKAALFFALGSNNLAYQTMFKETFIKLINEFCKLVFIKCFQAVISKHLIKIIKARKNSKKYKLNTKTLSQYLLKKLKNTQIK